ncbi:hypothetical protein RD792_011467 [Penstemon davidsonii]|uniref:Uncharacterized protein n=1 Tax=Penstemon davidsonii TaxID=160366 RepID=A0ABR0D619_9LAMI|nr:hypothetical protein RD792_011467 [Penstemon davidsonii]
MNKHIVVCKKHPDNIVDSTIGSHTIHSFCRSVTGVEGQEDYSETALIFQRVFERYALCDVEFRTNFRVIGTYGKVGYPTRADWVVVEKNCEDTTTLHASNFMFFSRDISGRMKAKFDKYLRDNDKMNMIVYVAIMLNPRNKFDYLSHVIKNMHGYDKGLRIANLAIDALAELFNMYKSTLPDVSTFSSLNSTNTLTNESQTSESAFNTGGRVIDDYRASLAPRTAQALIFGQYWINQAPISFLEEESEVELNSSIYNDRADMFMLVGGGLALLRFCGHTQSPLAQN